jgi:uncharacterized protein YndB with AHSA1/START domain
MAAMQVSTTRVIAASADRIFGVLADPAQHPGIDGSGSVQAPRGDPPARLALGSKFGMAMRIGVRYGVENEVVEFEEGRRIGWRHDAGVTWRYQLDRPVTARR